MRLHTAAAVLLLGATALIASPTVEAGAVDLVPFSITIRHANCVDPCDEEGVEGIGHGTPDFFVKVFVNGVKLPPGSDPDAPSSPIIVDDDSIDPMWTISTMIPAEVVNVPVTIQLWDDDPLGQDLADLSPHPNDNNLDLSVVRQLGTWTKRTGNEEVESPQNCSTGGGGGEDDEPAARLCFDLGGDSDGDGLLDSWERTGYDDNSDGIVDVDLPRLGADPNHKDLFLELDWIAGSNPSRPAIHAIVAAFAAAPENAGWRAGERRGGVSAPTNPDGLRGINLHVDTGDLIDPRARIGQTPGTCHDSLNNGGGDLEDGSDRDCRYVETSVEDPLPGNCTAANNQLADCLVGDPRFARRTPAGQLLGDGEQIANPNACELDGHFYSAKRANFRTQRRYIFRYAILASQPSTCNPRSGGWGEIGGNDFIVFFPESGNIGTDPGTIMHELGHTLNLRHGGFEDHNCKPNYLSVMNYDLQRGIERRFGGRILDYSPPRISSDGRDRGRVPSGGLDEQDLDENVVISPGDSENLFVFVNSNGDKIKAPVGDKPNWNGDADNPPAQPYESDVVADIDIEGKNGQPASCSVQFGQFLYPGPMVSADDWSFISLSFHSFGDSADGAVSPQTDPEPTFEEMEALEQELNTTDLEVSQTDSPDPVAAGTDLRYTLTVANLGNNPANSVRLVDTLPGDVVHRFDDAGCTAATGVLTCYLGSIAAHASRAVTITVSVPADLVYRNGAPKTITNTATVDNLAGPDPHAANNVSTVDTRVIAVADVRVAGMTATGPLEVLIGEPGTASLSMTVENLAPSSPIDTVLSTVASADPGVVVTPASTSSAQEALAVGQARTVSAQLTLQCTAPGSKTVTLVSRLALRNADDVDPDPANNAQTASFEIDCVVPIAINVRPGGFPNSINLNTDSTLAALTTTAGEYGLPLDFDATTIDASTVRWGLRENLFNAVTPTGAPEIHGQGHPERSYELDERTRDADSDLVLHFKPSESGLNLSSTQACLKGKYVTSDGSRYTFLGCDSVRVVN
ncbi:MAG TPA: hypothetical protein VFC19_47295 [Candidatus Limnocylindrales bacterium]|nr:hypothetical protein [Candidatus Limnocylindrales bacterium]